MGSGIGKVDSFFTLGNQAYQTFGQRHANPADGTGFQAICGGEDQLIFIQNIDRTTLSAHGGLYLTDQ
ncbi:MAG: hypothetical protein SPiTSB_00050 [Shewanella algae]